MVLKRFTIFNNHLTIQRFPFIQVLYKHSFFLQACKDLGAFCENIVCSGYHLAARNIYYSVKGFTLVVHIYSSWFARTSK